jgi:hypothetical protein
MRPSQTEIIRSIEYTLSEYVAPEVTSRLGQSGLASAQWLLRNLAVRLERETSLLHEDNADKRTVLTEFVALLGSSTSPELVELASDLSATLVDSVLDPSKLPTLERITDESVALRGAVDHALQVLGRSDADGRIAARELLVAQLQRQASRDEQCFDAEYTGRLF